MKKLITILFFFVSFIALSQNNGINFQGVGRNSSGAVLASTKISLRFSVIQSSETGTVEYVESKEVTTNAQGIFSVVIGDGTQISKTGNFSDINWKINPKFLKVEMDPAGGTSFVAMGTTRLQAVPFANYANGVNADNIDGVLSASKGGTGVASISALKTALAIDQINNTSDLAKPISTATQAALDTKVNQVTGKELSSNDYTTAEKNKLAAITGTNTGDQDLSGYATTTQLATKANTTDLALKAPIDSPSFTGTVSGITKAMVGLSNVENTADLAKPISTATQAALDLKTSNTTLALKENIANKSSATDLGGINPSDILYPTQKAVKDYVTANAASGGIADGGVTSIKIANGAVGNSQLASNSINSSNVIDGTITNADININASIPFSKLNISKANIESLGIPGSDQNTTYSAGNGLTLSGTTFSIGTGAITSTAIADGTISNVDINSSAAIDYSKLNIVGSIVSTDISNSAAIPFSKLNIVKSDIEGLGIPGSDQNTTYTAGNGLTLSGTTFSIGAGSITSSSIADGTISNVDINSSAAIDYSKLNIVGSIVSTDISNSAAIPFSKLNIVKSDIEGLGIPGSDQNTTYTAGNGLTLSGTTFSIGSGAISSTSIADGTISNVDVNSSAAIDYSKLNLVGSIVSSDISNSAAIPFSKLNIAKSDIVGLGIPGSDQNTTYTAGNGLTLSGTTFSIGTGAITSTTIADGTITNIDVNSSAAIDYSKLNLTGSVVASDISNTAAIPFSKLSILKSDITNLGIPGSDQNTTYTAGNGLTLTGTTFSIGAGAITNTTIADDAISTAKVADASITSSKISGAILVSNGGTGLTTLTSNSVLVGNGTSTVNLVAPGTSGNVLKSNGTTWVSGTVSAGATSVGAISSGNNSNGGYISGGVLTLAPAGSGYGGIVINGDQNFSGNKVFNDNVTISNNLSVPYGAISFGNDISVNSVNIGLGNATFINCLSFGNAALASNTSGVYSTALGYYSLQANTTGQGNTATGANSLKANTTGYYNTAMGASSLLVNTTGKWNTAIGNAALGASNGDYNTAIGYQAMNSSSTGSYNTAVGYNSGWSLTSGSKNTSIGYNSLTYDYSNSTVLGANAAVTGNNQVQLGDYQTTAYAFGSLQNRSDARDKVDVRNTKLGLDFIMSLRPVDYKYNYRDSYRVINADGTETYLPNDGSKTHKDFNHGFIAQEVQSLMSEKGFDFGGVNDQNKQGGKDVLYLGYTEFIAPMVKAIQDQQSIIEQLKKDLAELKLLIQNKQP
ncbi:MAG: virus [Bacteroidota bacterium]|jgi:hypothetical protein